MGEKILKRSLALSALMAFVITGSAYADVEKTFGGEVDTNWQWNLGVRYSF